MNTASNQVLVSMGDPFEYARKDLTMRPKNISLSIASSFQIFRRV